MKKIIIVCVAVISALTAVAGVPEQYRDSVPTGGYNSVIIDGADPAALFTGKNHIVTPAHLSSVGVPDSDCVIIWPHGKISACHKPVLYQLFPDVKHYIINGATASKADFDVIPASFIFRVSQRADTLEVTTRTKVDAPDSAIEELREGYWAWALEQLEHSREGTLGRPLPEDILISVDHFLHPRAEALAMLTDSTLVEITGTGNLITIDFYSRRAGLSAPANAEKCVEVNVNSLGDKTLPAIIAASGIPVEEVNFIYYLGGRALVGSLEPDLTQLRTIPMKVAVSSASSPASDATPRWVYVKKTVEPDGITFSITPEAVISAAGLTPEEVTDINADASTQTITLHTR